jgi:hypothetical protein
MKTENQRNTLQWALEELSSHSLQENLWLGKIDGQMSSFSEAKCGVFDDSGLGEALTNQKSGLPPQFVNKAKQFQRLLSQINSDADPTNLLANPKMADVRAAAAELLLLLPEVEEKYQTNR